MDGREWDVDRPEFYGGYSVRSRALVCPMCLETWATMRVLEGPHHIYDVCTTPCETCIRAAHHILHPVPGSLIDDWRGLGTWDDDLLDALPAELVKREFELTMKAWEHIWIQRSNPNPASRESTSS